MRLLYFVDAWPSLFEVYLCREMQWMRGRGHSLSIVSLNCTPNGYRRETTQYVDLTQFGLEDVPALELDSTQMASDAMLVQALSFARLHRAQLIDAHLAREPAELACKVHRASGIPYAVRMRGGDVHTRTSPRLAEILNYASVVCPMSQFLADVLVGARMPKKIPQGIPANVALERMHIVPNSLPVRYLASAPTTQSDDLQVIGAIGRVVPSKRFQDIIGAVAGLIPDFPGLQLKIIGGGVAHAELQTLAFQAGIANRFEITGFKPWSDVMSLARQLHIYVQSSEVEGCSLATIEAAFQGIPLVLSRTGANEQCVEQGINGYLFDSGDVGALRESLRSLLLAGARKRERMGRASLEIMRQRFTAEAIMPGIEAILQAAINDCGQSQQIKSGGHLASNLT